MSVEHFYNSNGWKLQLADSDGWCGICLLLRGIRQPVEHKALHQVTKKLRFGFVLSAFLLLAPALPRVAGATDIVSNFNIQGTAQNITGETLGTCASNATCSFSGTMAVDTAAGSVTQFDVTFPGLPTFSIIDSQTGDQVVSSNSVEQLAFNFTASPAADTLVGFTGGTIDGTGAITDIGNAVQIYNILTGSISAASTVPEPGSPALLAAGLFGLGFVTWRRRRRALPPA